MSKLEVRCPSCHKIGIIQVNDEAVKNMARGLLAINVEKYIICEHSFILYIDKNLQIRDYFITDFQIEIPELYLNENEKDLIASEITNLDLIKLNFPVNLIIYIIRSVIYNKKVVVLFDDTFLSNHFLNFLKNIFKNTFNIDITIISNEEYKNNKKSYKNYMIFNGKEILNNYENTIDIKKIKLEKSIVHKFFSESDPSLSLIFFKNEIQKLYRLSMTIRDFINTLSKKEKVNITKISENLEKTHNIKVDPQYLNYLLEIVKNYFNIDLPIVYDSFLGFL